MKPPGLIIIAVTVLFPAYQLFMLPDVTDQVALFSQYLGMAALVLMAWGQILSTRLLGIETVFGGMDRVYVFHKWASIVAMGAILLHDTIDAEMNGLGRETALNELAETLGELSLYGLLILVVISVATFIPYHLWKWTHKGMGALFATGVFHFVFIMKPFAMSDPAGLYTAGFCIAGIAAYFWTLLPERMRPSKRYRIDAIAQTGGATAITLTPEGRALKPRPGQFGVFSFTGAGLSEPHPFSFSGIEKNGTLRVTVKALGDFTDRLKDSLAIGQEVRVQGPFGRFVRRGQRQEVWIAGGIGITPIMTWARALDPANPPVDLFYCVRTRDQAPHLEEIEELANHKPNLTLHLMISSEGHRISAEYIANTVGESLANARISYCGPAGLRDTLKMDLRRYGVTSRNFHYEEFEFRTGIGLERLAHRLVGRALEKTKAKHHQGALR